MKGYCGECKKVIDETEIYEVNGLIVCHECFDILEGNKVVSFGTWKKMTRKERKANKKSMIAYENFYEANKNKECVICGMDNPLFEIHKINNGKYCYDGETVLLCGNCISNNKSFDDLFQVASNVFIKPKSKPKPYLCQICKLTETCQNNFDYECVEASDFLFTLEYDGMTGEERSSYLIHLKAKAKNRFTVKDDFLNSLIDKDHIGLRDKRDDSNEREI